MATDDIIQYLDSTDADGTALGGAEMHRRQVETFLAGGTIAAGDVVGWDTTKTGAERALYVTASAVVGTGNPLAVGVALKAAASGDLVPCVIAGYAEDVKCAGGTALGVSVAAAKAAIGTVALAATGDLANAFGVTLEAEAGGTVDMIVYKQF